MTDPDDQLLEQLRQGDDTAFERLFLRHYGRVYRALYGLVGNHEEAEDLVQETFLALYTHPPRPAGAPLAAWLCRVALNCGYNTLRGQRRAAERDARATAPVAANDPHDAALRAEQRAAVRAALARLPERQGKLLLLRHAGLSYAEIAAALDVAPGSVGTLLIRAERSFQAEYERLQTHTARMP